MNKIKGFFRFTFVYKPLNEYQAHATKFQIFKFWCRNGLRRVVMAVMVIVVAGGSALIYRQVSPRTVWAERQVMNDSLDAKVVDLKADLINRLASCESQGSKESDGLIVFDTNSKASIGVLQFQKKTVIYYYKTLYNQIVSPKEAVEIALDSGKASKLASDVIFQTENGLTNWVNCSNKLGLASEVRFINKISK